MTLLETITKTYELQDTMNKTVNPDWIKAGYPWYRAAWVESAELLDHMNYKWWKNVGKEGDREQILLELVDIYHFMVSDQIVHNVVPMAIVRSYERTKTAKAQDHEHMLEEVEAFVQDCIETKMILPVNYCRLVSVLNFTLEEVLKWYIAKNALNIFRQDHGYKAGTYVKTWNGDEDNVVLAEFVRSNDEFGYDDVYKFLDIEYAKIVQ